LRATSGQSGSAYLARLSIKSKLAQEVKLSHLVAQPRILFGRG